jgi:hypothetical protein
MMLRSVVFAILAATLFAACSDREESRLEELDLMSYGVPIVIEAPPDAEVKTMDLTFQQDITVKSGEDFYVQIFASDASTTNPKEVKEELLKEVRQHPYFSELIMEEDVGFIYKTAVDTTHTNYGFRYVRIQGDREYTFQTGLIGRFNLEQVERMYDAVK